jgi:hypothetical protein
LSFGLAAFRGWLKPAPAKKTAVPKARAKVIESDSEEGEEEEEEEGKCVVAGVASQVSARKAACRSLL